jgi:hypothetical protein
MLAVIAVSIREKPPSDLGSVLGVFILLIYRAIGVESCLVWADHQGWFGARASQFFRCLLRKIGIVEMDKGNYSASFGNFATP